MKPPKKKLPKRTGAAFKPTHKYTDKPSADKLNMASNKVAGPTNRADDVLKTMMSNKPAGMKQVGRRTK